MLKKGNVERDERTEGRTEGRRKPVSKAFPVREANNTANLRLQRSQSLTTLFSRFPLREKILMTSSEKLMTSS